MANQSQVFKRVTKEAKRLRAKDKNRKSWLDYMRQAWAIEKRKHPAKPAKKPTTKRKRKVGNIAVNVSPQRVTTRKTAKTYNVPTSPAVGSLGSHLAASRQILEDRIGKLTGRYLRATTKSERKRLLKEINDVKRQLKRLS